MLGCRAYYTGYTATQNENVPKFEEGIAVWCIRYALGIPFILFMFVYLLNPEWLRFSKIHNLPDVMRFFGVIILILSALTYYWTHKFLGINFTDTVYVRDKNKLVDEGPYKYVRHPMYLSGILAAVGAGLTSTDWIVCFSGVSLMFFIMYVRTPTEEAKLLGRHGEVYQKYMNNTGRYFPKIRF